MIIIRKTVSNPYGGESFIIAAKLTTSGTENTLSFLAPQGVDYLYAACINNDGKYFQEPVYVPRRG